MEYRKLGKWGIRVSEVGLGSWLTYGGAVEEKAALKQIHYAFEQGINFFDTANVYAHGNGEVAVGRAIKTLNRDAIVLATKVYFPMDSGPNDKGLSRKHVFEQCHASLKRLGVDYIDLYQCHRFDADVPMYEIVRTMDDLIKQGKILYWGVSEWRAEQIEDAVQTALSINAMPPVSNQPQYNMLSREIEKEVIPTSMKHGLGQVVFSPLAQGVLSGKYKPDHPFPPDSRAADNRNNAFMVGRSLMSRETLELVQKLVPIASDLGITMSQLALAWCLRLPNISSVIMGATKTTQIEDNIKATNVKLKPNVVSQIEDLLSAASVR
jgi:voltage-dependent potassium channel beta subunit